MKIMFLGDTHADVRFMRIAIDYAAENRAKVILQAGDFGIWDHVPAGVDYLDETDDLLEKRDLWLIFADGNHENFDSLYSIPIDDDGFRRVRERILHAPRGHTWELGGLNFLAFGGASSIDGPDGPSWWGQARGPGNGWWPEERITEADIHNAIDSLAVPIDVMLTHDAPSGFQIPGITRTYPEGEKSREAVRAVMEAAEPQLLVHGHYHRRSSDQVGRTRVEGLSSNEQTSGQVLLLETDPFTLLEDELAQRQRVKRDAAARARTIL